MRTFKLKSKLALESVAEVDSNFSDVITDTEVDNDSDNVDIDTVEANDLVETHDESEVTTTTLSEATEDDDLRIDDGLLKEQEEIANEMRICLDVVQALEHTAVYLEYANESIDLDTKKYITREVTYQLSRLGIENIALEDDSDKSLLTRIKEYIVKIVNNIKDFFNKSVTDLRYKLKKFNQLEIINHLKNSIDECEALAKELKVNDIVVPGKSNDDKLKVDIAEHLNTYFGALEACLEYSIEYSDYVINNYKNLEASDIKKFLEKIKVASSKVLPEPGDKNEPNGYASCRYTVANLTYRILFVDESNFFAVTLDEGDKKLDLDSYTKVCNNFITVFKNVYNTFHNLIIRSTKQLDKSADKGEHIADKILQDHKLSPDVDAKSLEEKIRLLYGAHNTFNYLFKHIVSSNTVSLIEYYVKTIMTQLTVLKKEKEST